MGRQRHAFHPGVDMAALPPERSGTAVTTAKDGIHGKAGKGYQPEKDGLL